MKKYVFGLIGLVLLDLVSKSILVNLITNSFIISENAFSLIPHPYLMARITSFFNLVFTWNPGTSFSMFQNIGLNSQFVIIFLTLIIITYLIYLWVSKLHTNIEKISFMMIIAGAIGNLIDRIRFNAVVDFLDFHIGAYHWPAFNIADVLICCGVLLYIYSLIRKKH